MDFIKIEQSNGKILYIAKNKIVGFHETDLTEKGKAELGEDKTALKIETLENRQYLAVGTADEIKKLILEITESNNDLKGKIETVLDKFLNPPERESLETLTPLSGITLLEDLDRKYDEVLHRLQTLETQKPAA
ncbi:hypothetical protein [Leptospira bandrabouensis]|uniref:hypothetical protein n=1 Tax=Leptospira bandrabouensis TaxID=2484903 RepID=UPI001EECC732|nr:hypothetical protein [Leptospira bandrabouensis]MCG6152617.1 hypothetical protein [Leptospira bandrabouensis]